MKVRRKYLHCITKIYCLFGLRVGFGRKIEHAQKLKLCRKDVLQKMHLYKTVSVNAAAIG